ncbi:MAG: BamA/TamA family outer membrane protein [Nitrospirae bacterium]|nr:BamA/TamA family outer membrane protein [Nitrospirota bacterium]
MNPYHYNTPVVGRPIRWIACFWGALCTLAAPPPCFARLIVVPVPMFSLNPTTGYNAGLILSFTEIENEFTESILAPSGSYHESYGPMGTFRYYRYTPEGNNWRVYSSLGGKNYHESYFDFRVPRWWKDRVGFRGRALLMRDPAFRFYGYGAGTTPRDESHYAYVDRGGYGTIAFILSERLELGLDFTLHRGEVRPTHVGPREEYTLEKWRDLDGLRDAFIHSEGYTLRYDSRDRQNLPHSGSLASLGIRGSWREAGSGADYWAWGGEVRRYVSFGGERLVLAARLFLDQMIGDRDTPFFERPTLGGKWSFRGYGYNRFTDWGRVAGSVEQRWLLARAKILRVPVALEPAVFVEVGRVFGSFGDLAPSGPWARALGGSWRFIVTNSLVASIDVGVSPEGPAAHVSLDYPF